jgi:thioredoxin 1
MFRLTRHPLPLGITLVLAAVLVSGCERVRSLAKTLKPGTGGNSAAGVYSPQQVTTLDAAGYDAFIAQKNKLLVVDFYADWCGPCRMLSPMLEAAAAAHPGVVFIGRLNVEQAKEFAAKQRVQGIPDVRIFKDGQEVDRFVGCPSEAVVMGKIATLAKGITPAAATAADKPAQPAAEPVKPMPKNWLPPGIQKR